jgi:hypothetical protein
LPQLGELDREAAGGGPPLDNPAVPFALKGGRLLQLLEGDARTLGRDRSELLVAALEERLSPSAGQVVRVGRRLPEPAEERHPPIMARAAPHGHPRHARIGH